MKDAHPDIRGVRDTLQLLASALPVRAAEPPAGRQAVFLAQKCNTCHAVSSAGIEATTKSEKMKGPDLVGVVPKKGEEWTGKYLRKEIDKTARSTARKSSSPRRR